MEKCLFDFQKPVKNNISTWNVRMIIGQKIGGALIRGEALIRDYTVISQLDSQFVNLAFAHSIIICLNIPQLMFR